MQYIEGWQAAKAAIETANQARTFVAQPQIEAEVRDICEAVRQHSDEALLEFCRKFDYAEMQQADLRVSAAEIEEAWDQVPVKARIALRCAANNIRLFHEAQKPRDFSIQTSEGAVLGGRYTPLERAGIYAPNGRAAYPSTVLMLAVPAQVAGVKEIVLATPAGPDGKAHPIILAAAKIAGISEIYKIGGAYAVAALAYGTPTVPRVDKIAGPGSIYFTLAKKQLFGVVGIDGLYGPSEVAVIADESGNAAQLAADLLAQAEHGGDSFVVFISPSKYLCQAVQQEVESQAAASSRAKLALETLGNSLICCVETMEQACEIASLCAAEHVEVWSQNARAWSESIQHAGAIFLNTPVPFGDYIIGPSHTLPTGATARFAAGVGVDTFLKRTSLVSASREAMAALAGDLEIIALLEDLPGHAAAAKRAAKQ